MPEINDYSEFGEFKTPGLYTITNKHSATVLDLPRPAAGIAINGGRVQGGDNQKWQIVDVGNSKYVIICRQNGTYVCAIKDGDPVKSSTGYPDLSNVHWKIEKPDATHPEITEFHSVKYQGAVLELRDGSDKDQTPVSAHTQNGKRNGQKWLLKKITQ